ncbi:AAA family ATPase [Methanomethylophilus alvi]|uniref:AAA family ATPase n=1 Tax=Methanomethylophilus alvi TaxID=1291540 RepID=UPI0037DDAD76
MNEEVSRKYIPIGMDDFKEIRDGNYYFVDKSELISDILDSKAKVHLFTRPRRFGKSLNLSMVRRPESFRAQGDRGPQERLSGHIPEYGGALGRELQ